MYKTYAYITDELESGYKSERSNKALNCLSRMFRNYYLSQMTGNDLNKTNNSHQENRK